MEACLNQCAAFGYPAAGMEFGDECCELRQTVVENSQALTALILTGCGDIEDVTANSPGFSDESNCNIACSGDPIHLCGGPNLLQVKFP